jgi:hypothetical protein
MLRSYTAADLLMIGNAACGTIAIFLCLDYVASGERRFLWTAFALLPAALVCDVLDGYVARRNRARQSRLGADLDSLADVISFGVAPAILGFTLLIGGLGGPSHIRGLRNGCSGLRDLLEVREHQAPMGQFALGEQTREGQNRHPQALRAIRPRAVTLEAENSPACAAKVAMTMRLASHLDPPTTT